MREKIVVVARIPWSNITLPIVVLIGLVISGCFIHEGNPGIRPDNKLVGIWEGEFLERVPSLNLSVERNQDAVRRMISRIKFTKTEFHATLCDHRDTSHFLWMSGSYERIADTLLLSFEKTDVGKFPYPNPVPFVVYLSDSLLHISCIGERKIGDKIMMFPEPGFLWDHHRLADGSSQVFGVCECDYRRMKS